MAHYYYYYFAMINSEAVEKLENDKVTDGMNKKLINLTLINGTGYVFDADDYMELRRQHRILGILVGSCGWSADENTLPAELTTWETKLLVEKNIAQLVCKSCTFLESPSAEQLAEHAHRTSILAEEQMMAFKAKKLQETQRHMKQILAGKRRKLNNANMPVTTQELNEEEVLKATANNFVFDKKFLLSQTHCAYPEPHRGKVCKLTGDCSLMYCVFRDCWQRGFYVMSGETFGADFLLYPGDPLIYHASHMVILMESRATITALELIAKARILEENIQKIAYQTIEWQGEMEDFVLEHKETSIQKCFEMQYK